MLVDLPIYASNKNIVKVVSNIFTNMNAIQGWGDILGLFRKMCK